VHGHFTISDFGFRISDCGLNGKTKHSDIAGLTPAGGCAAAVLFPFNPKSEIRNPK
jgi:hypothetical protein